MVDGNSCLQEHCAYHLILKLELRWVASGDSFHGLATEPIARSARGVTLAFELIPCVVVTRGFKQPGNVDVGIAIAKKECFVAMFKRPAANSFCLVGQASIAVVDAQHRT